MMHDVKRPIHSHRWSNGPVFYGPVSYPSSTNTGSENTAIFGLYDWSIRPPCPYDDSIIGLLATAGLLSRLINPTTITPLHVLSSHGDRLITWLTPVWWYIRVTSPQGVIENWMKVIDETQRAIESIIKQFSWYCAYLLWFVRKNVQW